MAHRDHGPDGSCIALSSARAIRAAAAAGRPQGGILSGPTAPGAICQGRGDPVDAACRSGAACAAQQCRQERPQGSDAAGTLRLVRPVHAKSQASHRLKLLLAHTPMASVVSAPSESCKHPETVRAAQLLCATISIRPEAPPVEPRGVISKSPPPGGFPAPVLFAPPLGDPPP